MATDDERLVPNGMKKVDPLQLEQGRLPVFETKAGEHIHELQLENEALRMDLANAAQQRQLKDAKIAHLNEMLDSVQKLVANLRGQITDLKETVRAREDEINHLAGISPTVDPLGTPTQPGPDPEEEGMLYPRNLELTPADRGTLAWIRVNGKVLEQMVRWWRETVSVGEALDRPPASNVNAKSVPMGYEARRDQAMEKLEGAPLAAQSGVGQAENAEPPDETCGL